MLVHWAIGCQWTICKSLPQIEAPATSITTSSAPRPRRSHLTNFERARLRRSLEERFHVKGGRWETRTLDLTDVNRAL